MRFDASKPDGTPRQLLREPADAYVARLLATPKLQADRVEALINGWFYNHVMHVDRDYVPMVIADKKYRSERLDACRANLAAPAKRDDTGSPD